MIEVIGKTGDGKAVVAGVFRFRETYGMPLDVLAEILFGHGMVISWEHYAREALTAGSKAESVSTAIVACACDLYGCPSDEATRKTNEMMRRIASEGRTHG